MFLKNGHGRHEKGVDILDDTDFSADPPIGTYLGPLWTRFDRKSSNLSHWQVSVAKWKLDQNQSSKPRGNSVDISSADKKTNSNFPP